MNVMNDNQGEKTVDISVLIPISERFDDLEHLFKVHHNILKSKGIIHEFIFILDGNFPAAAQALEKISGDTEYKKIVTIIKFNRSFGEAKAIATGFSKAAGKRILTLASYFQVRPEEIEKLLQNLTDDVDIVFGSRYPRRDNLINRIQSRIFHGIVNRLTSESFHDISCGVRLMRREVMQKISLYGDLHRFIPLLAVHKGFQVKEIPLQQAEEDIHLRVYQPGVYLRRILDILTLFFLIKFTQKPLRFFGLLGCGLGTIGLIISSITILQRIFTSAGLAERPLFLIGILFLLIGMQTFFIGLVGEIIIFTHMPAEADYNIDEFVE
jgi:glycosyltransferase involved in cell wall biosynthesis